MLFFSLILLSVVNGQNGPGSGPWEVATPESQGLVTRELEAAEAGTNSRIGGRTCYIVIKNGKIVHERYRLGGGINARGLAWSCTKSMCGSLYGVAVEQGWANVNDRVSARNRGTRTCNNNAQFRHVLTMTGQSSPLNPRFSYDTTGALCLDTIADFIEQNNPDGLSTENWKNRFWHDVLGLETMEWGGPLLCGFGASTTCRDMARVAQLYLNDGAWAGHGQVMNQQYAQDSRKQMVSSGTAYGYTVWRRSIDLVDPDVSSFNGMFTQCAYMSKRHEAVILTMGIGDITGAACENAWTQSRNAVISSDVRHLYNETLIKEAADLGKGHGISHQEIVEMGNIILANPADFDQAEVRAIKEYFVQHGLLQ